MRKIFFVLIFTLLLIFSLIFAGTVTAVVEEWLVEYCSECHQICDDLQGTSAYSDCIDNVCTDAQRGNREVGIWVSYDTIPRQCISFGDITKQDPVGKISSRRPTYRPLRPDNVCYTKVEGREECIPMPSLFPEEEEIVCYMTYYIVDPGYYSEQDKCVTSGLYSRDNTPEAYADCSKDGFDCWENVQDRIDGSQTKQNGYCQDGTCNDCEPPIYSRDGRILKKCTKPVKGYCSFKKEGLESDAEIKEVCVEDNTEKAILLPETYRFLGYPVSVIFSPFVFGSSLIQGEYRSSREGGSRSINSFLTKQTCLNLGEEHPGGEVSDGKVDWYSIINGYVVYNSPTSTTGICETVVYSKHDTKYVSGCLVEGNGDDCWIIERNDIEGLTTKEGFCYEEDCILPCETNPEMEGKECIIKEEVMDSETNCPPEGCQCKGCIRASNKGEPWKGVCTINAAPHLKDLFCCETKPIPVFGNEWDEFFTTYSWAIADSQCQSDDFNIRKKVDNELCSDIPVKNTQYIEIQPPPDIGVFYQDYSTGFKVYLEDLHHPPPDEWRTETPESELECEFRIYEEYFPAFDVTYPYEDGELAASGSCDPELSWNPSYSVDTMPVYIKGKLSIIDDGRVTEEGVCQDEDPIHNRTFNKNLIVCPNKEGPFDGEIISVIDIKTERNKCSGYFNKERINCTSDSDCKNLPWGQDDITVTCGKWSKKCRLPPAEFGCFTNENCKGLKIPYYNEETQKIDYKSYNRECNGPASFSDTFPGYNNYIATISTNVQETVYSPDDEAGTDLITIDIEIKGDVFYITGWLAYDLNEDNEIYYTAFHEVRSEILSEFGKLLAPVSDKLASKNDIDKCFKQSTSLPTKGSTAQGYDKIKVTINSDMIMEMKETIGYDSSGRSSSCDSSKFTKRVDLYEWYGLNKPGFWRAIGEWVMGYSGNRKQVFNYKVVPLIIRSILAVEDEVIEKPLPEEYREAPKFLIGTSRTEIRNDIGNLKRFIDLLPCLPILSSASTTSSVYFLRNLEESFDGIAYQVDSLIKPQLNITKEFDEFDYSNQLFIFEEEQLSELCNISVVDSYDVEIDPSQEYVLQSSDRYMKVTVPQGAFSEATNLTIGTVQLRNCVVNNESLDFNFSSGLFNWDGFFEEFGEEVSFILAHPPQPDLYLALMYAKNYTQGEKEIEEALSWIDYWSIS